MNEPLLLTVEYGKQYSSWKTGSAYLKTERFVIVLRYRRPDIVSIERDLGRLGTWKVVVEVPFPEEEETPMNEWKRQLDADFDQAYQEIDNG